MACEHCMGGRPLFEEGRGSSSDRAEVAIDGAFLKVSVLCDSYVAADELIPIRVCPMCGADLPAPAEGGSGGRHGRIDGFATALGAGAVDCPR